MTSSDDLLGQEPVDDSVEFALSASAVEAALFGTTSSVNIGRFVILGELGRGGMGVVYSAWDPQLDRRVALKVVRPELSGSRQDERIRREAKAAARLSDPHIVAVHEVGESDGRTFIAMEYVEGVGLEAFTAAAVGVRRCVEVYVQAARGLAAAHDAGIVHRDFKPSNVLVSGEGEQARARVSDFGVARVLSTPDLPSSDGGANPPELTRDGTLLGTPSYMAPEQIDGAEVGPAADQFSFCVALFEALVGHRPFEGNTIAALHEAIVERRLATSRSDAPGAVLAAVRRGLEPDPTARHASMQALIDALLGGLHRRRRWLSMGAVTAGLVAAAVGGAMSGAADAAPRCDGAASTWEETALRGADAVASLSEGTTLQQNTKRAIDAYGGRWIDARTRVCTATHVEGTQSSELLDVRVACLDQMQFEATALFDALADEASPRALDAVTRLDPPEHCVEATEKTSIVPPADPTRRDAFESLQRTVADARTDFRMARWKAGHQRSKALVEAARSYGDDQLLARSMSVFATFEARVGDPKDAAATTAEALAMAVEVGNNRDAADIATGLVYIDGYLLGNTKAGEVIGSLALAWAGNDAAQRAAALENLGLNAYTARNYPLAESRHRQAQQLLEPGPASIPSAINLGTALAVQGDVEKERQANALFRDTLTLAENTYGREHPSVAALLQNTASRAPVWLTCEEALPMLERALEIKTRTQGKDAVSLHTTLTSQANCLRRTGNSDSGLLAVDRALSILERKLGRDSPKLLGAQERRIETLISLGRLEDAEAQIEATAALSKMHFDPDDPENFGLFMDRAAIAHARGDDEAALKAARRGVEMARTVDPASPWTREHELFLARLQIALGQVDEGRALAKTLRDEYDHPGPLAEQIRRGASDLLGATTPR